MNRPGFVGDSILWKRGWSHGQKRENGRRYSGEEKAAAVRMVRTLRAELGTERGTAQRVALQLGNGVESVRSRVRQAAINDGLRGGVTSDGVA